MRCILMDCSQWSTSGLEIIFDTFKSMPTIHKLIMAPQKATGFSVRRNIGPFIRAGEIPKFFEYLPSNPLNG